MIGKIIITAVFTLGTCISIQRHGQKKKDEKYDGKTDFIIYLFIMLSLHLEDYLS